MEETDRFSFSFKFMVSSGTFSVSGIVSNKLSAKESLGLFDSFALASVTVLEVSPGFCFKEMFSSC